MASAKAVYPPPFAALLQTSCCPLSFQALGEALQGQLDTTADKGAPKAVKPLTEDWPFVD